MVEITEEMFIKATKKTPLDDDLERCNCPKAGELGHSSCGWNKERNLPQFYVGPVFKDKRYEVKP